MFAQIQIMQEPVFFVAYIHKTCVEGRVYFANFTPIDITYLKGFLVGFFSVLDELFALGHGKNKALARMAYK